MHAILLSTVRRPLASKDRRRAMTKKSPTKGGPVRASGVKEEDASDDYAVFERVVVVIAPLAGRTRSRSAFQDQRGHHVHQPRRRVSAGTRRLLRPDRSRGSCSSAIARVGKGPSM